MLLESGTTFADSAWNIGQMTFHPNVSYKCYYITNEHLMDLIANLGSGETFESCDGMSLVGKPQFPDASVAHLPPIKHQCPVAQRKGPVCHDMSDASNATLN